MARRQGHPLYDAQYCGNTNEKKIHNLDNEKTQCQIDEIIKAGYAKPYYSLIAAYKNGYDNCPHCIDGSTS